MNKSSSMWCQSVTHNGPHLLPAHFTLKWAADSGAILIHLAVKATTPGVCAAPDPARSCWNWTLALPLALLISLTKMQTPRAWAALQSTCWNPTRMEDSWRKKINFLKFSKRNPRKKSSLEACCVCLRLWQWLSEEVRRGQGRAGGTEISSQPFTGSAESAWAGPWWLWPEWWTWAPHFGWCHSNPVHQ